MSILCFVCLSAGATDQTDFLAKLVSAYGMNKIDQVEAIRFTYNYQLGDERTARSWVWEPTTNRVTLTGSLESDEKVTFDRDEISEKSTKAMRDLDAFFQHDAEVIFLPLWVAQAKDAKVENGGYKLAPLGRIVARELIVTMPGEKGDVYRLYVDDAWRINQWQVERGGDENVTGNAIWTTDEQVGPLLVCTRLRNPATKLHVWYSDVAVKTKDVAHWQIAKQVSHRCRTCP